MIERHRPAIEALCREHAVARLDVFGSAATGRFDEAHSDVDFLVEFEEVGPVAKADAYFGLLDALKKLLGREVDLVTTRGIRNPHFRRSAQATRQLLYAT